MLGVWFSYFYRLGIAFEKQVDFDRVSREQNRHHGYRDTSLCLGRRSSAVSASLPLWHVPTTSRAAGVTLTVLFARDKGPSGGSWEVRG